MAIRKIATIGNPILRQIARALSPDEILSPEIKTLVQDMRETMHASNGIGLAAPQVHESVRLALIEFQKDNKRYPEMGEQPLLILFNPVITVLDPTPQSFEEGCLSVPEQRSTVARPKKIRVDYLDENAVSKSVVAEGFLATVFQHEVGHLEGELFVDIVR